MRSTVAKLVPVRAPSTGGTWRLSTVGFAIGYVLLSSSAAVLLSPPEVVRALLAVPAFAIIPALAGSGVSRLLPGLEDAPGLDGFGRLFFYWLLGCLLFAALAVALQLSGGGAFLLRRFGLVALALAVAGPFIGRTGSKGNVGFGLSLPTAGALALAVLLSMAPKLMTVRATPFPMLGHNFIDPLFFSQPAERLLDHGYLGLENLSHAPGLLSLVAILSQLFDLNPVSFLWAGPFLLYGVFGLGLFLWGRAASGQPTTALLTVAIGLFILTGHALFQGAPVILRSNTLLLAIFPLSLYVMHRLLVEDPAPRRSKVEGLVALQISVGLLFTLMVGYRVGLLTYEYRIPMMLGAAMVIGALLLLVNRRRWHWGGLPWLFLAMVGFHIFHVLEAPIFLTALVVYGLAITLRGLRFEGVVAAAVALAAAGFFLLQASGVLSFPRDFSLVSSLFLGSTYDSVPLVFNTRVQGLERVLPPAVIALVVIGAAGSLLKPRGSYGRTAVIAAAVMFTAYILPDVRAHRPARAMIPFLAFLLVAGADYVGAAARTALARLKIELPSVQVAAKFALVAGVMPMLVVPFGDFYTSVAVGMSHHSTISDVEYALADWFRENTGENVRIISDDRTMLVLSSLSNKVSLTERTLLNVEKSEAGREQMSWIRTMVLRAPTAAWAYAGIRALSGTEPGSERRYLEAAGLDSEEPRYYVVWTFKTCLWSRFGSINPIPPVVGPVFPSTVTQFSEPYFRKVGEFDGEAYVFELLESASAIVGAEAPGGPQSQQLAGLRDCSGGA